MKTLEIKNVYKSFGGIKALHNVSLTAQAGNITGIIGPNGSGKSTLINILTGIIKADSGTFSVSNLEKENTDNKFARTFQDSRLWGHMTVLDTILIAHNDKIKAVEIIKKVKLDHHIHTQARHLSYGQRKLLEIGRAIAAEPAVLLLDEPFAGLHPETIIHVKEILSEQKKKNTAIILIEHDMNIIRDLCDYVYVLDAGMNIAEGKANEVLENKEVIRAYLGK